MPVLKKFAILTTPHSMKSRYLVTMLIITIAIKSTIPLWIPDKRIKVAVDVRPLDY